MKIVEKTNLNGNLRDEIFLVCNSIRNDLKHPNEYIRGKTLRLLQRIMYKGILDPLSPTIVENLEHKNVYVKKNAISLLNIIYSNFRDEIICDIDELMEKMLKNESEVSTKRNAFLLLYNVNQEKALNYVNQYIINDQSDEVGDIVQLVVLELLRLSLK